VVISTASMTANPVAVVAELVEAVEAVETVEVTTKQ
jgi:hypothetical protein